MCEYLCVCTFYVFMYAWYVGRYVGELVDPSTVGLVGSNGSPDKQVFLVAFFKNNNDQTTTTTITKATRRKRAADNNNKNNNNNNKRATRQHDSSPQNDDHQIWYRGKFNGTVTPLSQRLYRHYFPTPGKFPAFLEFPAV